MDFKRTSIGFQIQLSDEEPNVVAQETLVQVFWERVRKSPDRTAILWRRGGKYHQVSWRDQGDVVGRLSIALLSQGLKVGDRVAIMSHSRPQWTHADLAALSVGAVTVPVYPTLNPEEAAYILRHCEAAYVFVENESQLNKLLEHEAPPPAVKLVVLMETSKDLSSQGSEAEFPFKVLSWETFLELGRQELEQYKVELDARMENVRPENLATIVYTSGTTGVPKGAMIRHSNIYFVCQALSHSVGFHPDDIALSFLPLSHIFERVGGQFLAIYEGIVLAYAESMEHVSENMKEVRPTIMNAVPRFYEKAYNRAMSQIRHLPGPQQYLIRWALSISKRALKSKEEGSGAEAKGLYRTELRIADRLVFRKIRQRFGGRLRFLVSGAAPLSGEVHQFFESIGMPILEGYGLTETTAPVTCNKLASNRRGTVGQPLPGVEVKIAEDGEILVKGPNVFFGYYKNPEATAESIRDGWFYTGDIGELDGHGYLKIRDRKKDIIITAGGKHVAPQFLENLLAGQGLVSRVLVYGDRRKYISALVTLSEDELKQFAKRQGISYSSLDELHHHPQVSQEVQSTINRANDKLAGFEQIKRHIVIEQDFSVEANELTPTLKLKRKVVTAKYKELLDSMYDAEDLALDSRKP